MPSAALSYTNASVLAPKPPSPLALALVALDAYALTSHATPAQRAQFGQLRTQVEQHPQWGPQLGAKAKAKLCHQQAVRHEEADEPELACQALRQALALQPFEPSHWFNLGRLQEQQQQWAGAKQSYLRTLHLQPQHTLAHYGVGVTCTYLQQWQEAVTHFEAALAESPAFEAAWLSLGSVFLEQALFAEAKPYFKQALAVQQRKAVASPRAWLGLAVCSEGLEQPKQAQFYYQCYQKACQSRHWALSPWVAQRLEELKR